MSEVKHHLEADPFVRVIFNLERGHGTCTIHEADCGLKIKISGLKDDLAHLFGVAAQLQRWTYNTKELDNEKSLPDYDINGATLPKPLINVKQI